MLKKNVIWQGSPSLLLLIKQSVLITLCLILCFIAQVSQYDMIIAESIDWLISLQIFFKRHDIAAYAVYLYSAINLLLFVTNVMKIKFENYILTDDTLHYNTGVINRNYDETRLFRILDISIEAPLFLRLFGYGNIIIYSNDPSTEESIANTTKNAHDGRKGVYLSAIKHPLKVKEILDKQIETARTKHGIKTSELM